MRYVLGASAGQRMTVEMTTSNASAYFNITAPGATEALHIGSVGELRRRPAHAGGNYAVEVYLMRNAARRGETAEFTISFRITGAGADGEGATRLRRWPDGRTPISGPSPALPPAIG